jgi:hypothetical protein
MRIYLAWAVSFLFPNNPLFSICCEACLHKYYLSRSPQNNKFISSNNNGSSSIQCSKTNPEQEFQATAILAVKNGSKKSHSHKTSSLSHNGSALQMTSLMMVSVQHTTLEIHGD